MIVAVQPRWTTGGAYTQVAERAVSVVNMPALGGSKSEEVLRAVLARRARRGSSKPDQVDDMVTVLFTDEAITALAERLRSTRGLRSPLAWLRDTLEFHGDNLPERIDRVHLLEVL